MILTCAIIDDEPLAVTLLEGYVRKTPFLRLEGTYNSAVDSVDNLVRNPVDILFLDIQMPEINGLEFSRIVNADTRIIFTTAFSEYALDSYRVNALDYLLKPISYADFLKSCQKALGWYELLRSPREITPTVQHTDSEIHAKSIFVRSDHKLIQVELSTILYIESLKDYVRIHTEESPEPLNSLMSIQSLENMLPDSLFLRVHRSFIVNLEKIKVIDRNRIVFGREYIPISDSYRKRFLEFLNSRNVTTSDIIKLKKE